MLNSYAGVIHSMPASGINPCARTSPNLASPRVSLFGCDWSPAAVLCTVAQQKRACFVAEAEHEHVDQGAAGMPRAWPLEDDRAGDVPVAPQRVCHGGLGAGLPAR